MIQFTKLGQSVFDAKSLSVELSKEGLKVYIYTKSKVKALIASNASDIKALVDMELIEIK